MDEELNQNASANLINSPNQLLSAQITCVLPMHIPAIGKLTLSDDNLNFVDNEGKLSFEYPISTIEKVKTHNSLHLTLYVTNDKTRHLYFTTNENEIITNKYMTNYKAWMSANMNSKTLLSPWLDYFQQKGLLVQGSDEIKNKKRLRLALNFTVFLVIAVIIFVLISKLIK